MILPDLFKDLFFPKICILCKRFGKYICVKCEHKLKRNDHDVCVYCKLPSPYGLTHIRCFRKKGIDGFISIFKYHGYFEIILKKIKFKFIKEALYELLFFLKKEDFDKLLFLKEIENLFIIPVPLHKKRLKERSFNQSEIIANFIAKKINLKVLSSLIERHKYTSPQSKIKRIKDRYLNIKQCFSIKDPSFKIKDKSFLIVDDVLTTGATIKEVAQMLKLKGAKKVFIFTLAT